MTEALDQALAAGDACLDHQDLAPRPSRNDDPLHIWRAVEWTLPGRDQARAAIRLDAWTLLNQNAHQGLILTCSGKGETYREVSLTVEVRETFKIWLRERSKRLTQRCGPGFFLNPRGKRPSAHSIDLMLRRGETDAIWIPCSCLVPHLCDWPRPQERSGVGGRKSRSYMSGDHAALSPSFDKDRQNAMEQLRRDF
jgi:hypothetical protein